MFRCHVTIGSWRKAEYNDAEYFHDRSTMKDDDDANIDSSLLRPALV